ncbi:MAG: Nif3-like dinuclear metal center hexameric protein [Gammaproteobacteria bacterium]|nr:Nif3-like dinuclear metal center hexameric protein [Gammaproteobacteria bacterium]
MDVTQLSQYLDELLQVQLYSDYAPNGLQIAGKPKLERICTAVSASLEVIQAAVQCKADALLVHHGYFWKNEAPQLVGIKKERVKALMVNDMNLFAYHLPLDCHLELGNNVQLGKMLQLTHMESHTLNRTPHLLWSGQLAAPQSFDACLAWLRDVFGQVNPVQAGERPIKRIAWCTGAAQDYIESAASLGVDAYISGEISERTYCQAKELGLHYFACGHHATEKLGIQALGNHLATQFQVTHHYIDSDNPY